MLACTRLTYDLPPEQLELCTAVHAAGAAAAAPVSFLPVWMTGWGWVYHQELLGVSLEPAMVWIVGMCARVLASGVALLRCGTTERWGLVPRTVLAVK